MTPLPSLRSRLLRLPALAGTLLTDTILAIGLLWLLGLFCYRPESLVILLPLAFLLYRWGRRTSSWKKCLRPGLWAAFLLGLIAYKFLPSPHHANWKTPWALAPRFEQVGDVLTIHNLRDFRYRSEEDYDVHYRSETYDLTQLTGVDFGECHWDGLEAVCHTMLSFSFADGRHLVVSAETRLPEGVEQNGLGGIYKLYGMLYVFGSEEDIFALRTNYRHEDLTLYPLKASPEQARKLLQSYVDIARETEARQLPYNTVTDNCSSGVIRAFRELAPEMPALYNLLPLHNSSISRLIYEHGGMRTRPGESFEELSRRCYLGYDLARGNRAAYSAALREKRGN